VSDSWDVPGRLKCGTVNAPDFAASLADYSRELGMRVVEEGRMPPDLARSWGAPAQVGRRWALLHGGGRPGYLRLVEGTAVPSYRPLRSYGWAAFECSVRDAFALHERIDRKAFPVLGPPKRVPGFDTFIPFQVRGRAGEVLYLNTVLQGSAGELDLPFAEAEVDAMFIAVLAAQERAETVRFHERLGFAEGETWTIPYSMINQAFELPDTHLTAMTMTRVGRMPASEIDQYPPETDYRSRAPGELPPGNAMVSVMVQSLDAIDVPFIEPPLRVEGALYGGRRVACVRGPSDELVELIECGAR
jgi:catechol 2,3-dioxygenase-like lactoylglutathione lyase family enzyme